MRLCLALILSCSAALIIAVVTETITGSFWAGAILGGLVALELGWAAGRDGWV